MSNEFAIESVEIGTQSALSWLITQGQAEWACKALLAGFISSGHGIALVDIMSMQSAHPTTTRVSTWRTSALS